MCTQKPPHDYSQQLYDEYRGSFEEYITSTVLPSLKEKHDELMLRELVKRWQNHKVIVRWLSHFIHYLDCYFIARRSLPPSNEVGLACFRNLVYTQPNVKVRDAVTSLIDREREGEQIDRALLKNVLDIFVEIGMGHMEYYKNDFEADMMTDTAAYYSRKASNWILEDSCPVYLLKIEECLREKERVSHYLHSSSEPKLLEQEIPAQCSRNLSAEMVKCVDVFKEFYQTKTKHKKLTWICSLGMWNVNGKFESKTVELVVSTYQGNTSTWEKLIVIANAICEMS